MERPSAKTVVKNSQRVDDDNSNNNNNNSNNNNNNNNNVLSPPLFKFAMMPLNHILRKCTAGYELGRLQEKINHLMYI